jgi:hypothetical protein
MFCYLLFQIWHKLTSISTTQFPSIHNSHPFRVTSFDHNQQCSFQLRHLHSHSTLVLSQFQLYKFYQFLKISLQSFMRTFPFVVYVELIVFCFQVYYKFLNRVVQCTFWGPPWYFEQKYVLRNSTKQCIINPKSNLEILLA